MSEFYNRYPTILKCNSLYIMCINTGMYRDGISKIFIIDKDNNIVENKIIEESKFYMTHNLTIIKGIDGNIYAIGGLIRNQKPFLPKLKKKDDKRLRNMKQKRIKKINKLSGVYILKSKDYNKWEYNSVPIFSVDKIPKNKLSKLTIFGENLIKIKRGVAYRDIYRNKYSKNEFLLY